MAYYQSLFNMFKERGDTLWWQIMRVNYVKVMVNDGSFSDAQSSSSSSSSCFPQNLNLLRLYISASSWCTYSPFCYLTWKKKTREEKLSVLKRALIHPPAHTAEGGTTAHTHISNQSATLRTVQCNKGISLGMDIPIFYIRPLEISLTASSRWTPLCVRVSVTATSHRGADGCSDAGASSPEIKLDESGHEVGVTLKLTTFLLGSLNWRGFIRSPRMIGRVQLFFTAQHMVPTE